ncbi:glycoside hydrolase domain-containing protein [Halalkalibacter lacteus]|uniref:glycoside hydrolase domain-containing protein n=1 Tax=Halalkalibacter lacteus TaxID=3090663 RepID=UPI002FC93468
MKNSKNLSIIILGVVSLLFVLTLSLFSQANTTEPVTASTNETEEEQTTSDHNNSSHNNKKSGNGNVTNTINNSINAEDGNVDNTVENNIDSSNVDINNSVENHINSENADIDNSIENHINSGHNNNIDNSITNDVNVSVDVNVTNYITNQISGDDRENDEETGNDENGENENSNGEETLEAVWGVDSASVTTEDLLACVRKNFGDPQVWGRYLDDKEGVSYGLTTDEIELLHSNDIQILVIWNHFTDGTGYKNGQNEANAAIESARDLGIPEGVALFANVEPIYPIDSAFIQGWHDVVSESEYNSGIYGIFAPSEDLYVAFETAAEENASILDEMYVWTAAPNEDLSTEENAPEYNPVYPDEALIGGWQYGLDAETCNIDTNIFDRNVLDVLW